MKAQELMIGDWVLCFGQRVRVNCVASSFVGLEGLDSDTICKEGMVEPIPLTPEILRKNGFGNEMRDYLEGDEIEIELNLDEWELEDEDGFLDCGYQKPITYVHELQHALRLLGIEKEIVL